MDIFQKIKSFFKRPQKESFDRIFQDYLKIRSELQISDVRVNGEGINFKVNYRGSVVPFWLSSGLKTEDALSIIAVGLATDLNLVEISQMLREWK